MYLCMKNPLWRYFGRSTCQVDLHCLLLFILPDATWMPSGMLTLAWCYFISAFPTHTTPPYCFHSNAITEMTAFSCSYHSSLSSVHIWRLSSSQECCSLQQIVNFGGGGGCMCLLQGATSRTILLWNAFIHNGQKLKNCDLQFVVRNSQRMSSVFIFILLADSHSHVSVW